MLRHVCSAVLGLVTLASLAGAQTAGRSAVAGIVRDTTGRGLPNVTVTAQGRDASAVTDSAGRFHLQVPSGLSDFTVMRIGYRAVHFEAEIAPDTTVMLAITMRALEAQPLAAVEVREERMSARLLRDGFYDRRERGFGQYLSPDQVEKMAGTVTQTSQMLRMMNGVQVRCPAVGPCQVTGTTSCLSFFVDGVKQRNILLDERVSPSNVYAVEVYPRRSALPQEFVDPVSQCGAIVVWTRSRAP